MKTIIRKREKLTPPGELSFFISKVDLELMLSKRYTLLDKKRLGEVEKYLSLFSLFKRKIH
jgi:hypothetical protein